MKKKALFGVALLVLVALVAVIWAFSAQDAVTSYSLSDRVMMVLLHWFPGLSAVVSAGELALSLRTFAHFVLYMALGMVITWLLAIWDENLSTNWAIMIGGTLAILDELHQKFTPGRHACFDDVVTDVVGVCFGIIVFSVIDVSRRALFRKTRL